MKPLVLSCEVAIVSFPHAHHHSRLGPVLGTPHRVRLQLQRRLFRVEWRCDRFRRRRQRWQPRFGWGSADGSRKDAVAFVQTAPITLQPGEEILEACQGFSFNNPDEELWVTDITITAKPGVHHSDWIILPDGIYPPSGAPADYCFNFHRRRTRCIQPVRWRRRG